MVILWDEWKRYLYAAVLWCSRYFVYLVRQYTRDKCTQTWWFLLSCCYQYTGKDEIRTLKVNPGWQSSVHMYIYMDHLQYDVTMRSSTGYVLFIDKCCSNIEWHSTADLRVIHTAYWRSTMFEDELGFTEALVIHNVRQFSPFDSEWIMVLDRYSLCVYVYRGSCWTLGMEHSWEGRRCCISVFLTSTCYN